MNFYIAHEYDAKYKDVCDYDKRKNITNKDIIVGSGELINVKNFVQDIFKLHNKKFKDYILVEEINNLPNKRKDYYSCVKYSNYEELLNLTIKELYEYKIS
jgi:hypothetical protein